MLAKLEDVQKMSQTNIEATTKAFETLSQTSQAIATEMANYSKRSFDNNTKAIEKLFGVKSLDKAIEVQSEFAKMVYEDFTAHVTKLSQLYADLSKEALRPFETQMAKASSAK